MLRVGSLPRPHYLSPEMCLAIPGQILSIEPDTLVRGRVAFGGVVKDVCLAYVPEARVGDYVIVHVGFAISRVNREEAERTLSYLSDGEEA